MSKSGELIHTTPSPDGPRVTARYPFDDSDSDVVLRTIDNVYFFVHKIFLSLASTFFKGMFSLPNEAEPTEEMIDGRPCIAVQDDSDSLYQLLSWCDPRVRPSNQLDDLLLALVLADKYGMLGVIEGVQDTLESSEALIKKDCLRIYATAIRFNFIKLAKMAAKASLHLKVEEFTSALEFAKITGTAVFNLYDYHFTCGKAARAVLASSNWEQLWIDNFKANCQCETSISGTLYWQTWWTEFMKSLDNKVFQQPEGISALDSLLRNSTLEKMVSCHYCQHLPTTFLDFLDYLAAKIDGEIDKVPIAF